MNMRHFQLISVTMFALVMLSGRTTFGQVSIESCQVLDQADTVYYLDRSLSGAEVTPKCMYITAENVTLDCQGYSITNSTLEDAVIRSEGDHVTIRNCNVQASLDLRPGEVNGLGMGIFVAANYNKVENSIVTNSFWGIKVSGKRNFVQGNELEHNAKAIHVGKDRNIVKNNIVKNNSFYAGWGLGVWSGQDNEFVNNKVYGSRYGVVLYDASGTRLECGLIYNNAICDIYLYSNTSGVVSVGIDFNLKCPSWPPPGVFVELPGTCDCQNIDCIWEADECVPCAPDSEEFPWIIFWPAFIKKSNP